MNSIRSASGTLGWALAAALVAAAPAAPQTTSVGLSTVRAVRFGNDNLSGIFTPEKGDHFAWSLAVGDFDGDGADDLATGMPDDNGLAGAPIADSGSVVVRFSTVGGGLTLDPSQVYIRQAAPVDPPDPGDLFGEALAACDFDHDGRDDLAIGIPGENHLGRAHAGAVELHLGADPGAQVFFTQSTDGVPGDVEEGDRFGSSLACGDFDADGFADLVVGVANEDFYGFLADQYDAGMLVVIPGFAGGLDFNRAFSLHQDVDGMVGEAEVVDLFGSALAVGDFNGDSFDDLAIGVPGEDEGQGVIQLVFGSAVGLTADGNLMWSQSFLGGSSEEWDLFGDRLAAGDFDGNGVDDLAIGVSREDFGSTPNVGQVHVVPGFFPGGLNPGSAVIWTQDAIFGAGSSEANDFFGAALATGDFDHDGHDDLAIGYPGEFQLGDNDGGVAILMGTSEGLSTARHREIAAGFDGFPGDQQEHHKAYGEALATGDFDGDGSADLAIGAPFEDKTEIGVSDVGSETVVYGSLFADGVENGDTGRWSQTVQSPNSNRVRVTQAAKLGPPTSKLGLHYELLGTTPRMPGPPAYVRVGPEAGFQNETRLAGSFFVDPRALTMSPTPGQNRFQMMAFEDGRGITRLAFDLSRNAAGWALIATYFNENTGVSSVAGTAGFATLNEPAGTNHRIEFTWEGGDPGRLTVWHTTYVKGAPDQTGRVQLFSVPLPGMRNATISNVLAGMVTGQDVGTYGSFYLDELSFRR